MEEAQNTIQTSQIKNNNKDNEIYNSLPHHSQHNSFSNTNYVNNDLPFNVTTKENEENKINSNISTSFKSNQNYEIQIELDKNKSNKKYISNNNTFSNNYSKSPSYRNNKNINNHININKIVKPFFTHKNILLNKYSLKEVNECIYKDYNQLANILPYYQNYYFQNRINTYNNYNNRNNNYNNNNNINNNDAVLICLKYIEFSNFFFNSDITYKVQNLLFNIINGDRHILEQNKYSFLKNKLNEVYNKLIPYHIRYNYLKAFYDRNPDKNLYYLFKKDLDKLFISKYIDKKYLNYLYEIFEIVKQKMDNKKENIKIYINKLFNNGINNNLNNNKNGSNFNNSGNLNNINNNFDIYNINEYNSFNHRNHSFHYSANQNNNISSYKNINNSNRNNYMNGNNRKNNDVNNKEVSQFSINNYNNKVNNYKQSNSSRHYYYKNNHKIFNNNDKEYNRNKNNTLYKGELVEIEDTHNNLNIENVNKDLEKNNEVNDDKIDEQEYKNIMSIDNKENNGINILENDNENVNININNIKIDDIVDEGVHNKGNDNIKEEKIKDNDMNILNVNTNENNLLNSNINQNNDNNNINNLNLNNNNHIFDESLQKDVINNHININNDQKVKGNETINVTDENSSNKNLEEPQNELKNNNIQKNENMEEKEEFLNTYKISNINEEYENNLNEDNNDNEINNINNEMNIDFLYNTEDKKNNVHDTNNDNTLPKITYNDFNSSSNSLNLNNNNLNNLEKNANNIINCNTSNTTNVININNIINNYNNLNNGFTNINELNQTIKGIFFNQNLIIANINKYLFKLNKIKPLNNGNLYNDFYALNLYNLGISNNIFYNLNNGHNNKNYNALNLNTQINKDYIKLKKIEKDNPQEIKDNFNLFENNILLPIYNEINTSSNNQEIILKYSKVYSKYKEIIESILKKNNLEGTIVEPYGSIVNNFLTKDGDIDISIVPRNKSKDEFFKYLLEIEEDIIKVKKYAIENKSIYINSRYILLSITDIETNINIDISVHNLLPINNSKMLRLYSLFDQRFHIMGIFLKYWVKINNIKGAPNGYLSSYALLILIIHFLQNIVEPKILPILQEIRKEEIEYKYYNGEKELSTNLYFEEDFDKIKEYMNVINNGNENTSNVTELLVQFFEYYAYKYNTNNNRYLITIKSSEKKPAYNYDQIVFPIEDPFDVVHNPGKSMKFGSQQFSDFIFYMKKEINNIMSGEYFKYNRY